MPELTVNEVVKNTDTILVQENYNLTISLVKINNRTTVSAVNLRTSITLSQKPGHGKPAARPIFINCLHYFINLDV